jgi:hypothetical protein
MINIVAGDDGQSCRSAQEKEPVLTVGTEGVLLLLRCVQEGWLCSLAFMPCDVLA